MRAMTSIGGQRLLKSIGVDVTVAPFISRPRFAAANGCRAFETSFADHFSAAQDMAEELLAPASQPAFPGGSIWQARMDHYPIAEFTLMRFRKSYGIEAGLREQPVLVAGADEAQDAVAAMGMMMTYGSDCFFVAADAAYMVLSCDEMILTLVTAGDEVRRWYEPILQPLDFKELSNAQDVYCQTRDLQA